MWLYRPKAEFAIVLSSIYKGGMVMARKRKIFLIAGLLVAALSAFAIAGCGGVNDENGDGDINDPDGSGSVKNYCVVSFNSVYGSGVTAQLVQIGALVSAPDDPVREGYRFKGWYLDSSYEEKFSFETDVVNESIELYALWELIPVDPQIFTVSFHSCGGSAVETQQVREGEAALVPEEPTRYGYRFSGWYADDGYETLFDFDSAVAGDAVVYAKWEKIVYEENGFAYTEIGETKTLEVSAVVGYEYPASVTIPASVNGMEVVRIAEGGMQSLTARELITQSDVLFVGTGAFYGNESLKYVDFSDTYVMIGESAFEKSALTVVDLGNALEIGRNAFRDSALLSVTVPAAVKEIGDAAFSCSALSECGFEAGIPALGASVFGVPQTTLALYATEDAYSAFAADASGETLTEKIAGKLSVSSQNLQINVLSGERHAKAVSGNGIYRGESFNAYLGMGDRAFLLRESEIVPATQYGYSHAYEISEDGSRVTVLFDGERFTVRLLSADENGQTIEGGVLYDYQGSGIVYEVPEEVVEVADGAVCGNQSLRFVQFGDGLQKIGAKAFSQGTLLGVSFGTGILEIGAGAFGGQKYLTELIFRGEIAPTVGSGAFCYEEKGVIYPVLLNNNDSTSEEQKVWTPLSAKEEWSGSGWISPECQPFLDAFEESLSDLENLAMNGKVPVNYSLSDFRQLVTEGPFARGTQYQTGFGIITMRGTTNGYALVRFSEESGFEGGGWLCYDAVPGYDGDSELKKITVYYAAEGVSHPSEFSLFGCFAADSQSLVVRGAEAGAYGSLDTVVVKLDGAGNIVVHFLNEGTKIGKYSISEEGILTIEGIDGISSAIFRASSESAGAVLEIGESAYSQIGEEAGVYYDLNNAAYVKLDGQSYSEAGTVYDGKLTLVSGESVITAGYLLHDTSISFLLNGSEVFWGYSCISQNGLLQGDYEGKTMHFDVVASGIAGVFTGGSDRLVLDGYFTAKLNGVSMQFVFFGESTNLLLISEDEYKIIYLQTEEKTFAIVSVSQTAEAGKYYVTSSPDDCVYFDGTENWLFYREGVYYSGQYEFDSMTGELRTSLSEGEAAEGSGSIDLANGVGQFVCRIGSDDVYFGLSRDSKIGEMQEIPIIYYIRQSGGYQDRLAIVHVSNSDQYFYFSTEGNPITFVRINSVSSNVFPVQINTSATESIRFYATVTVNQDGTYEYILENDALNYAGTQQFNYGSDVYFFTWFDSELTQVGIAKKGSYTCFYLGSVGWNLNKTSFSIYKTSVNEGTSVKLSVQNYFDASRRVFSVSESYFYYADSSSSAANAYQRINLDYGENTLWVSNANISGAQPEVAEYMTVVIGGTTYYTFHSNATGKTVTFHLKGNFFVVDSET